MGCAMSFSTVAESSIPESLRFQGAGVELAADCWGDAAAPPVLLHGGGQTRAAWTQTAQHLAKCGRRAIALDLRAHGDRDWPIDGAYDTEDFAKDLIKIADRMGREGVSTFLEAVPHAEFIDVENAGHMVASDQNDVFSSAVAQFLHSVDGNK